MSSLGKSIKNHGLSLIAVAKIDSSERERERVHQVEMEICSAMHQLSGVMVDAIMEQIEDIQMQMEKHSSKLALLASTLNNDNCTPKSANDKIDN